MHVNSAFTDLFTHGLVAIAVTTLPCLSIYFQTSSESVRGCDNFRVVRGLEIARLELLLVQMRGRAITFHSKMVRALYKPSSNKMLSAFYY